MNNIRILIRTFKFDLLTRTTALLGILKIANKFKVEFKFYFIDLDSA